MSSLRFCELVFHSFSSYCFIFRSEAKDLLGDDWVQRHRRIVQQHANQYKRIGWGKVQFFRHCLFSFCVMTLYIIFLYFVFFNVTWVTSCHVLHWKPFHTEASNYELNSHKCMVASLLMYVSKMCSLSILSDTLDTRTHNSYCCISVCIVLWHGCKYCF